MENFQHQLRNVLSLLENIEEDLNVSDFSPNEKQVLYTVAKATRKENNISDKEICPICSDKSRNSKLICVVENIKDVMSIENTQQYFGVYHVLGGLISPMEGYGPSKLNINPLIEKVKNGEVEEIIFALSATMEGDITNFYIYKKIKEFDIKINTIARGISVGNELEYIDEVTLGRSIINRMPFKAQ